MPITSPISQENLILTGRSGMGSITSNSAAARWEILRAYVVKKGSGITDPQRKGK